MNIETVLNKIQRSHKLTCIFINPLGNPVVTTDLELVKDVQFRKIVGFYDCHVADWMLEEDFAFFGIDYDPQ